MHRSLASLLGLSAIFTSAVLHAQAPPALALSWSAPAGCPQEDDVRARIASLLGSARPPPTPLQADGTITQSDDGRFHLRLVIRSGSLVGERDIDSTSCTDLAGAAAVALGLLLRSAEPISDSDLAGPPAMPAPAATPKTPSAPPQPEHSQEPPPARPASQSADGSRGWHLVVQAPLVAVSAGLLPNASLGFGFGAGVERAHWRAVLAGSEWLHQSVPAKNLPGYGASVARTTAKLWTCRATRLAALEIAPCLTLSIEHVAAHGTGSHVASRAARATWLAAGGGLQGRLYLARWLSLTALIDGQIETSRPKLSIDGVGAVDQLGPAAVTVMLGPEWIL
jgi:hypothetical protein